MPSADARLDAALRGLDRHRPRAVVVCFGTSEGILQRTRGYAARFGWREVVLEPAEGSSPNAQLEGLGLDRIDVLHVETAQPDWPILRQIDLRRFRPSVVRLRRTKLAAGDLFATVRHFERHGYEVEWFYDEVIGLLPGAADDPAESLRAVRARDASAGAGVALYVISYNSPEQFGLWLKSIERANPEILASAARFLLDNSNDAATRPHYDRLCERHGFTPIRHGNLGITGGRSFCAKHFDTVADGEAMLWFEDDMLLQPPQAGLCRNGLRAHVPRLAEVARAVVRREALDFVKLSFSELFGDHHLNWAWYNVPGDVRERTFPDGTFRTRIDHSGVEAGVSYLVGEVHYSNWPVLITRRGNATLFLEDGPHTAHEAAYMARCLELERRGALRAGVLLASPVEHSRRYYYPAQDRREC